MAKSIYRIHRPYLLVFPLVLIFCLVAGAGTANSTLKATPRINLKYTFNDNIYGMDEDAVENDLPSASYMDLMLGILLNYRQGQHTVEVDGDLGYEKYLNVDVDIDNVDVDETDYDFMTANAGVLYRYTARTVTFELSDRVHRTRDLQEIFGIATDAVGYWSLYTDNVASAALKFTPSPKSRFQVRYFYENMTFDDVEEVELFALPNSNEHRILIRNEYDFSSKTTGIFDAQAASRTFEDDSMEAADFNLYQGLLGLRFRLAERTYLEALAGYAYRDIVDAPDMTLNDVVIGTPFPADELAYDLEDTGDVIGRITFFTGMPKRYLVQLILERGVSLYGTNLFFDYNSVLINTDLWVTPKLDFRLSGGYNMAYYELEPNGREWLWTEDRIDNIITARAALRWEILAKGNEPTLTAEVGYQLTQRDSNIDDEEDYETNLFLPWSYDSTINVYYAQIQVMPTILLSNK